MIHDHTELSTRSFDDVHAIQEELDQVRWDLNWARREIKRLQQIERHTLTSRLSRLRTKFNKLVGVAR